MVDKVCAPLPVWLGEEHRCLYRGTVGGVGFIEKNLAGCARFLRRMAAGGASSRSDGLLQSIEPSSRVWGILILLFAAAVAGGAATLGALAALVILLSALSRTGFRAMAGRVAPPVVFTAIVALPAAFGFITEGAPVWSFDITDELASFHVGITGEGLSVAAVLTLRVAVMVSLVALLTLATAEADLFASMRSLPVPAFFVAALQMTMRYAAVLTRTFEGASLARRSRLVKGAGAAEHLRWSALRVAQIFESSLRLAEGVSAAMRSRGFGGCAPKAHSPVTARGALWIGFSAFVFFLSFGV